MTDPMPSRDPSGNSSRDILCPLDAILLILSWEQLRLIIYPDDSPKHYPTGGWGHKLTAAELEFFPVGSHVSRGQANDWFVRDLARIEDGVLRRLAEGSATAWLSQSPKVSPLQFGALVCLAFNVGPDGLGSGLLTAVREDQAAVPDWIRKYNKSGGKVLPGLTERREAEAHMWAQGMRARAGGTP